jgi:hypothetical protein
MSRMSWLILAALLPACGVEGEPEAASLEEQLREEDAEVVSFDLTLEEASAADADADAPCEIVLAYVCVGGVCKWMEGVRCGNTLTVELPYSRDLIGMPITAIVPGVGVFTGKY